MLQGMRQQDPQQWERFVNVYSPLVYQWCRRAGVNRNDAADVIQDVFRAVAANLKKFRKEQSNDTFQGWLWQIARYKTLDHFRKLAKQDAAQGGSTAQAHLQQVPDDLPETWGDSQQKSDAKLVYSRILELLKTDFQTHTWQAFWKTAVEQKEASEVARELDMSVGAVYNARYKVLKRVREECEDLFDPGQENLL